MWMEMMMVELMVAVIQMDLLTVVEMDLNCHLEIQMDSCLADWMKMDLMMVVGIQFQHCLAYLMKMEMMIQTEMMMVVEMALNFHLEIQMEHC